MSPSFLDGAREWAEGALDALLPPSAEPPSLLHEAMRYAVLGGGKRLRPALAYASAQACGADALAATPVAAAVELVHAYSLVHDDLPAMDDDRERRGRPTVHVKFGEDVAILVGDALLALAFEALGRAGAEAALVAQLAEAAGSRELVGGQVDDLRADRGALTAEDIDSIHRRKTGALFRFSVCGGAQRAGADATALERLAQFARAYGEAFQITDDLLDGDRSETSILRVVPADAAAQRARAALARAHEALEPFGARAGALRELTDLVSRRLGNL